MVGKGNSQILFPRTFITSLDRQHKLLFNTMTGAIDVINNSLYRKLNLGLVKGSTLAKLIERGYYFPSEEILRETENKVQCLIQKCESEQPYKFVIIPNYACNFACDYCYEMKAVNIPKKMKSNDLSLIFRALSLITSGNNKLSSITLMGGEPLLLTNSEIISEVLGFASLNNMKVIIITNGGTLHKYMSLLTKYSHIISEIQVTLDGPENIHNLRRPFKDGRESFSQIVDGIKEAAINKLRISIRINLDSRNVDYIEKLIDFLIEQSWTDFSKVKPYFYPMSDGGCLGNKYIVEESVILKKLLINLSKKNFTTLQTFGFQFHGVPKFIQAIKSKYVPCLKYCDAVTNQYVFDPLGFIYKCWFGIRNPKVFAIGKYKPKFIIDGAKVTLWHLKSGINLPKCQQCKFLYLCGGGCSEKAWEQYRSFQLPKCPDFNKVLSIFAKFYMVQKPCG